MEVAHKPGPPASRSPLPQFVPLSCTARCSALANRSPRALVARERHVSVDETKQRGSLLVASVVVPSDLDSVRRTRRGHHQRTRTRRPAAVRDQIRSVAKGTPV